MNYYLDVLKNYVGFEGRARRKEYWMFVLFNYLIITALVFFGMLTKITFFSALYYLAVLIPSLAVSVRRLHDIGKGGVWLLIAFIPLIGGIWLLVLQCTEGDRGDNIYGEDPKQLNSQSSTY